MKAGSLLHISTGPIVKASEVPTLSGPCRAALYEHYNATIPQVHYPLEELNLELQQKTTTLSNRAQFYEWATLDGRRITPASRSRRGSAGSSLVQVIYNGDTYAGEVHNIFHHLQPKIDDDTLWAEVAWMKTSDYTPLQEHIWEDL